MVTFFRPRHRFVHPLKQEGSLYLLLVILVICQECLPKPILEAFFDPNRGF